MPDVRWIPDQPYREKTPFLTRANAGEVLPDPPSPLGWDLVFDNGGTVAGWRDCAVNRLGVGEDELDPDPDRCDFLGVVGGYSYLSASWIRIWAERTPGFSAEAIDLAYFGDHPDVPPYVPEPWHQNPATTAQMEKWLAWVMGDMDQSELEADRLLSLEVRAKRPDFTSMSELELLDYAISLRPLCRRLFDQHINQSGAAPIPQGAIAGACAEVGREDAVMPLSAGLGGVDSAAPSYAMWDLSRTVRRSPTLSRLFDEGVSGLAERLRASPEPDAAAFCHDFDAFLAEFGSRGPNEWDLIAETWETKPDLALAAIDRMRLAPDDESPSKRNAEREAERLRLGAEVREALAGNEEQLGALEAGLKSAATFVPGRERSKTSIVRIIEEARMAVREIGRRHVRAGELATAADLCLLFEDEVRALIEGRLDGVADLVQGRREHFDWLMSLEPPFIINGPFPPNTTWKKKSDHTAARAAAGEVLAGIGGCPGVTRGRACVVLDPSDPTVLDPGEILVAPLTDPAWTPLFVPAAGVVVDVGAPLSHAIIVSRELGLPCVVSVTDATKKIPNGALIEVDGDKGTVTVVETE
ncbi:MAG: PEP-utilizing enzyme [Dehalococcoidia bacterium]